MASMPEYDTLRQLVAERRERVERPARPTADLRHERRHVRLISFSRRLLRHRDVVGLLAVGEHVAAHQQRPGVRPLKVVHGLQQGLDGVLDVVALVDHVRRVEGAARRGGLEGGVYQLAEHQEQLVRLDRARRQVVIAVLGVVEVEAAELAGRHESRDNQLDVRIGQVVAQVH